MDEIKTTVENLVDAHGGINRYVVSVQPGCIKIHGEQIKALETPHEKLKALREGYQELGEKVIEALKDFHISGVGHSCVILWDTKMDANELAKNPPTTKEELLKLYDYALGHYPQYSRMKKFLLLAKVTKGMQKNGISWIRPGDYVLAMQGGRNTVFTWRPQHPQFKLNGSGRSDWPYWSTKSGHGDPVGNISADSSHYDFVEPLIPTKTVERDGKQIEVFDLKETA